MLKPFNLIVITAFFVLTLCSFGLAQTQPEQLTITTYYPSPFGSYRDLTTYQMKIGSTYSGSGYTAPTNGLLIEGNVGIGTGVTAPAGELDVTSSAQADISVNSAANNNANIWFRQGGTDTFAIEAQGGTGGSGTYFSNRINNAGEFAFRTRTGGSDTVKMYLNNAGSVTIAGTLTVNGDQSTATEHVFDDYNDIELLRKWRKGESLPFETGDMLNRDRLLRDAIVQLTNRVHELEKLVIQLTSKK